MRIGIGISLLAGFALANPEPLPVPPPSPGAQPTINVQGATIRAGGQIIVNGRALSEGQSFVQPSAAAGAPVSDAERAGHEAEHETIAKCVADMKSADAEVRLRAILILGKYTSYPAVIAVREALADSDAAVRRAALVALSEGTSYSSTTTPLVLNMLNDSDVHIRRIASSFLRQAMLYYRVPAVQFQTPQQQATVKQLGPLVIAAFADSDATVRRNMMSSIRYFSSFGLPASVIANGLRDEDREVRILALQALGQFSGQDVASQVKLLVDDPDQKIRFHVAEMLGNLPPDDDVTALLAGLAKDEDFEVSTSAIMGLLQADGGNREHASELRKRLDDPRMTENTARGFIRIVAFNPGNEHADVLNSLLSHSKASYRQMALESYAISRMSQLPVGALLTGAQDSAESVRSTALRYLGRATLAEDAIATLATSAHSDVRNFVADYCASLDPATRAPRFSNETIEPIVMELLLDDSNQVRGAAIRTIVSRQLPDWEFVAEETLMSDDEYSIQQQVVSLLRARPASHDLLRKALTSPTLNPNLRVYITNLLRAHAPRPTLSPRPSVTIQPNRPTIVRPPPNALPPR